MILLTKGELRLARKQRQIRDLLLASQLWRRYEQTQELMFCLGEICRYGMNMTVKLINAAGVNDTMQWWTKYLKDDAGCLDLFEGRTPTTQTLVNKDANAHFMQKSEWQDIGFIGGYFRFHAEVREKMAQQLAPAAPPRPAGALFDRADRIKNAISSSEEGRMSWQKRLEMGAGLSPTERQERLARHERMGAPENEREARWRQNEARALAYFSRPGASTYELYEYAGRWFNKHQGTVEAFTGDKMERQRARAARIEGGPVGFDTEIPADFRDFVRVPKHLNRTDPDWISGKKRPGIARWRQHTWDRLWIIAQLYGLPRGATISGTTTDHMFTIFDVLAHLEGRRRESGMADLLRLMYKYMPYMVLTPLVQMVSQFHHALLETCAALSLNDLISYHVGYYKTILPPEADGVGNHELYNDVKRLLDEADGTVTHLYAICDEELEKAKETDYVAWAVDPRIKEERDAHFEKALLNPTTAKDFEKIPEVFGRPEINKLATRKRVARVEPAPVDG